MKPHEVAVEANAEIEKFIRHVDARLEGQALAPETDVPRTIEAVLSILLQRLGSDLEERLERALLALAPVPERAPGETLSVDFDEFSGRVARRAGATPDVADRIIQAVFAELRCQLPPEARRNVASRLPSDFLALWNTADGAASEPAAKAGPERENHAAVRPELPRELPRDLAVTHPLLERIASNIELPEGVTPAAAFAATMCLLLLRVPAELARQIRDWMPDELGETLFRCMQRRDEEPTPFGEAEFLDALAAELTVSTRDVERIALAVFRAVGELLPPEEVERVASRLPKGLNVLWSGGHVGRVNAG